MKKKIRKDSDNFWHRKFTLKVRNWLFLSADFGVWVGLTMTWFSEKMLISDLCIHGLMCSAIKKSWKVSTQQCFTTVFSMNLYKTDARITVNLLEGKQIGLNFQSKIQNWRLYFSAPPLCKLSCCSFSLCVFSCVLCV